MRIIRTRADLTAAVSGWREQAETVALVPTMGALHAGHLALVTAARQAATRTIVSIFVNPTQFGPGEDLSRYPRQETADVAALADAGADLLYAPGVEEMYPDGFATNVRVGTLAEGLCGDARPGHFDGVSTVVTKLLNQARPDIALFGEKDWQQLAIIRRLAADLDFPTEIRGVPTVRDADGLALSSRNAFLSVAEREAASTLPRATRAAVAAIGAGTSMATALQTAREEIEAAGFAIDYLEVRGADDLVPLPTLDRPARLFVAAKLGGARLIDNLAIP
ncbi:MAG: pantoate--beta-alanine ligase [Pseudomonadota bacterium]